MARPRYEKSVFLNVPFDRRYEPLLRALVFTVHDCGFFARCAREVDNSGQVRVEKIFDLIAQSKLGIHHISRTTLDSANRLPRFNMTLELGVFLGAARFGAARQKKKLCLVLDRDPYRYQKYCSDISGQDIRAHHNRVDGLVKSVRDWLSSHLIDRNIQVPGHATMAARYQAFGRQLPAQCAALHLKPGDLLFNEHRTLVAGWLLANPWTPVRAD